MKKSTKTIELKFERTIPASPSEVYDAWLNPKIPGNPWNIADKLTLNPKVDGFFHLAVGEFSHYGRFTDLKRPGRIRHTWMSPNTSGDCDVLGGKVTKADPERDFVRLGEDFYIGFLYGDVPDESEFLRSFRAIWLELKSDNVEEMNRKILESGLVRKLEAPDPHLYFQAPGGQMPPVSRNRRGPFLL
jgi:uncharacterized protein YndB with AHSA1/START domain